MSADRILVAVPNFKCYEPEFVHSLVRMITFTCSTRHDLELEYLSEARTYRHLARRALASEALERRFDSILFLDDDMVFPPDTLVRLLEHQEPIVSALYFFRDRPIVQPIAWTERKTREWTEWVPLTEYPDAGLLEVGGIGLGCLLVATDVLRATRVVDFGFETSGGMGEDLRFCLTAAKFGFRILVDCGLKIGHMSAHRVVIGEEHFLNPDNLAKVQKEPWRVVRPAQMR